MTVAACSVLIVKKETGVRRYDAFYLVLSQGIRTFDGAGLLRFAVADGRCVAFGACGRKQTNKQVWRREMIRRASAVFFPS